MAILDLVAQSFYFRRLWSVIRTCRGQVGWDTSPRSEELTEFIILALKSVDTLKQPHAEDGVGGGSCIVCRASTLLSRRILVWWNVW